eukprot:scaffold8211_cov117-Cylindrotheca_fusiformis.AAC.16
MVISTIYEAASLNNSGAYHLLNNSHHEAISSFGCMVTKTKELLRQQSQSDERIDRSRGSEKAVRMDFLDLESSSNRHCFKDSIISDDSYVCKSAIILSHDTTKEIQSHLLPMISSCAIYNLAIAYHLYGIRKNAPRYLRKALQYYEISYKIQKHKSSMCYNPSLVLCILNNVAMIHRCLNDQTRSKKFLMQMYSVMTRLDAKGRKECQRHWAGLWSNVLCLVLGPPSSAAAA